MCLVIFIGGVMDSIGSDGFSRVSPSTVARVTTSLPAKLFSYFMGRRLILWTGIFITLAGVFFQSFITIGLGLLIILAYLTICGKSGNSVVNKNSHNTKKVRNGNKAVFTVNINVGRLSLRTGSNARKKFSFFSLIRGLFGSSKRYLHTRVPSKYSCNE